jgi:hypothetical protein
MRLSLSCWIADLSPMQQYASVEQQRSSQKRDRRLNPSQSNYTQSPVHVQAGEEQLTQNRCEKVRNHPTVVHTSTSFPIQKNAANSPPRNSASNCGATITVRYGSLAPRGFEMKNKRPATLRTSPENMATDQSVRKPRHDASISNGGVPLSTQN